MRDALGMSVADFEQVLRPRYEETYRAQQAYSFVYRNQGKKWSHAIGLPKDGREWLEERIRLDYGQLEKTQNSSDGTAKHLVAVSEGKLAEAVVIPEGERLTLCLSSQIGCSLSCKFCHTGTQAFQGNLTAGEILKQVTALDQQAQSRLTNFVFMGQGEPLYNFNNVQRAIEILTDPHAFGYGHGSITLSTAGIVPLIPRVATDLGANLAVSLHAPNDSLRSQIMPINKTYPLQALIEACAKFVELASCATRRITFEYLMLDGINDKLEEHVEQLAQLIGHLPAHVNLLPFNPWPQTNLRSSPPEHIAKFASRLRSHNIVTTVRKPRGIDIMAACGQLKSSTLASKTCSRLTKPLDLIH